MWPAYVINLAPNAARLANAKAVFEAQGIGWDRIDAVMGADLPADEVARAYDAKRNATDGKYPLVPAEIGCYLSHIAAWERIAMGDAEGGFIFEDDFAADETLSEILERLSADHADWDMVKLFSFDAAPRVMNRRGLGADGRFELVEPYRVPTCLIGYGLTRDAARHLAARAIPFFRPVDEDQKFVWETGLTVKLVLPAPVRVGDQQAVTGTIGASRRAAARGAGGRLRQTLRGLSYQARYAWRLWRHRRGAGQ